MNLLFRLTRCVFFTCSTLTANLPTNKFVSWHRSSQWRFRCTWFRWLSTNFFLRARPRTRLALMIRSVWTWTTSLNYWRTKLVFWPQKTWRNRTTSAFRARLKTIAGTKLKRQSLRLWRLVEPSTTITWSSRQPSCFWWDSNRSPLKLSRELSSSSKEATSSGTRRTSVSSSTSPDVHSKTYWFLKI